MAPSSSPNSLEPLPNSLITPLHHLLLITLRLMDKPNASIKNWKCISTSTVIPTLKHGSMSYPIHSRFSSEVLDARSDQIRFTDPYWICCDKLLHSYPVHITLNTAYFLHLVYPPFQYISYAYFRLCLLIRFTCD